MANRNAEFKQIGGQRTLVSQREPPGGVLPSLEGGGSSGSNAVPGYTPRGLNTPRGLQKQRGILSEVVRLHEADEIKACNLGPKSAREGRSDIEPVKRPARASGFQLSRKMRDVAESALPTAKQPSTAVVPPKVIKVHNHRPGDIPRKVTVERQQKRFEGMDIEELLQARGISFSSSRWEEGHWLTLDDFDNTEYDIRTPQQWIEMGHQESGEDVCLPVSATGLRLNEDRSGTWQACVAIGTDRGRTLVQWLTPSGDLEKRDPTPLTRLQILYNGEDPENHADRIQFAFESLKRAQSRAQLNFFIDNMPSDDIQCLDTDQVSRVLDLARNSPSLREGGLETAANGLVKEANLDFARTMNKIIFISHKLQTEGGSEDRDKSQGEALFESVNIDELLDEESAFDRPVPMFSLWPVPEYSFTETFSAFCFASLLIKPEVVSTNVAVAEECLWLLSQSIYNIKYTEATRLDYFMQLQKEVITATSQRVKEQWVNKLQKIMLQHFTNVGKGWFSIHETNPDTYRQGKMRKLLSVLRFIMQDTLRYFALDSVARYCESMERYCPVQVNVQDLLKVESTFEAPDPRAEAAPPRLFHKAACAFMDVQSKSRIQTGASGAVAPIAVGDGLVDQAGPSREPKQGLFILELKHSEDKQNFIYSSDGTQILDVCQKVLEQGLQSLADVPQLDALVVPQLFRTVVHKQVLSTVEATEPWVMQRKDQLLDKLEKTLPALAEFLELFEPYQSLLRLDPAEYVKEKAAAEISTDETKQFILEHIDEEEKVLDAIPEMSVVGLFEIHCSEIRKVLASRHRKIVELLEDMLLQRFRDSAQEVADTFQGIFAQLRKAPKNIEQSTELREFMSGVPGEVAKTSPDISKCIQIFTVLESFEVKLTNDDFYQRWRVFACPKQTFDLMAEVEQQLAKAEKGYLKDMQQEQTDFDENLVDLAGIVDTFSQYSNLANIKEIHENVESVNERLKQASGQAKLFNSREALFGQESSDYSHLQQLQKEWEPFSNLWVTAYHWSEDSEKWMSGPFQEIDAKYCEQWVTSGAKTLFKTVRALEKREDAAKVLQIARDIKEQIDAFQPYLPIVTGLRNAGMRERHWQQVSELVGQEVRPDMEDFTLKHFVSMGMLEHVTKINDIGEKSGKELSIETQLTNMINAWDNMKFDCSEPYRNTQTYILKGADEVIALVDEQIVITQAMQFSPFNKPFKEEIDAWAEKLLYVSECLDGWLKVQRAWMYLQPIFDSPDIMKQLPTEGKKFRLVDSKWRQTMARLHQNGAALQACSMEGLLETWNNANADLDMVQKGLDDYLETKRGAFARFYFLSNDELLEILSQTKDPLRVQPFLSKVFEAMKKLTFTSELSATQMVSKEGEIIDFVSPVHTTGKNVETWMTEVENQMLAAIREVIKIGVESYVELPRTEWVLKQPGQVCLNSSQVHWTAEVEEAIEAAALSGYFEKLSDQLMGLVRLVRGDISKLQRMSIGALIVIDVHAKDTVEKMANDNITDVFSFEWISQLRYYWEVDDRSAENLWVRMVQTPFPYGYEYLGNSFRLVITPLTDMCYMTLMGAQSLNLGGAPAGPAGTGKTETTKDLAKALAKQCVVFNCSPEMDYLMVGKFFKGLASSGAWCCFDEFNRIYIEVLSVIAQQLLQLFTAKQSLESYNDTTELEFDSTLIKMKPTFNVFITMNPGYAGRSELPDNLAALFRPMAMMVPDYGLIGEISFYAFGFEEGRHLAKKMVTTFQLCSEQLSAQSHYDYGMRAVKTVIEAAGLNKRQYPEQSESQILLRALRDVNVPKFLKDDLPLFENIISDLFPGVERPQMDYGRLEEACHTESLAQNLQPVPYFVKKQFELFDMIQVRHGMMLVGPTGGGKTCCYRSLQRACTSLLDVSKPSSAYQKVHVHCLNPKSITQNQLYGSFDEITREWSDGVAAEEIRNATRDSAQPDHHWVMFDGPVDALWIESMNTVLDDNKKLCLVSGEIIALTAQMRMMFEVEDLEVASPATVSRCGMIYMEPESLGFQPLFDSWLSALPETFSFQPDIGSRLRRYCEELLPNTVGYVRKCCKEVVQTQDTNLVQSLFRMLDCYFAPFRPTELRPAAAFKEEVAGFIPHVTPLFFFAMVWSLGGSCEGSTRSSFSKLVWAIASQDAHRALEDDVQGMNVELPPVQDGIRFEGLETGAFIYDYFYDIQRSEWIPWMQTIPTFEIPRSARYEELVVPSIDSVRLVYAFQILITHDKHVLCPGPTGTGKSVNISMWLQKQAPENFQGVFVNFSAQTHVNQFQDLIDSKLEKRRRGVYGPPAGKKMVLFVDDLNMPQKEYYGAQPPIELLRQWHDHGGWYNRKELKKFDITDMVMASAMGPPGGGRTFITERLKRHYNVLAYSDLQDESIQQIFQTMAGYFFAGFDETIQSSIPTMIKCTVGIFKQALKDLLPTPAKSHYLFNLRDIWRVFLGLCTLSPKKANQRDVVIRCWCHEIQRVFGDRLTDNQDSKWMTSQIKRHLEDSFGVLYESIYVRERLIFASFLNQDADQKYYEEVLDVQAMKECIEEYLDEYNSVSALQMPLVMFLDACEHCARVCRVLSQPSGNVLLLGVGGSGRQSLTRLSTHMNECECFQIEVAKGYGMTEFRDDVKKCLMKCGVEDKVQVFLFCDTQIVKEDFVEAINNVLNSGDVPNLYANEDMEAISGACRQLCTSMGMQPNKANLFSAYLSRVKKNVHVVLAFSPVGDGFRNRLRMFPSLVNCCTINWFREWPAEALYSVAKQQLTMNQVQLHQFEGSLKLFQVMHMSVEHASQQFLEKNKRHVYITPTSYLELLSSFISVLAMKRKQVGMQQKRYKVGLEKIGDAEKQVSGLQQMLVEKKPVLEKTQKEVVEMMKVIEVDKAAAEEVSTRVAKEEAEAKQKAEGTQAIKDDAQKDLDEALPALDAAVACLRKLKTKDIQEVKSLTTPPAGVRLACEAICVMFQLKPVKKNDPNTPGKKIDDYWETSQKEILQDPKALLDRLFNFDKDNIPDRVIQAITPYMEREDFDPAAIKKASLACEALCLWVGAMYKYHFVAKAVEPKRQLLREAEADLEQCMAKLEAAQAALREVHEKIQKLETDYNQAIAKQDSLQQDMATCEIKLERAHKLIGGLGGEKARWAENVIKLTEQLELLPGDCIVAAGMVSYAGPFTSEYRMNFEQEWLKELDKESIAHNEECNMRSVLGEPVKIQQWVVYSLPNDSLSIENAIIIDRSRRWPLMIDPQRQANKYIKNMGKDIETGFDVCKMSETNFLRTLELGIQFGKWILLENIGLNLDPALEPILQQQKVRDGSGFTIKLGDKSINYADTFKFYLTTTLPNPHYSPETSVKVTLLNFAITPTGLEDQMLGIVVAKERPDLEEQKSQLVKDNAKMNKQLKEIEDEILHLLSASEGDVLEDDTLVDKVTASKQVSLEIGEKQEVAKVTEVDIDNARESYRPVAYRTAVLFFAIVELANIDPMYQYSLQWFQQLFQLAVDQSPKSDVLEERLEILQDFFTESLYQNICRGLFEKDKTLFSFALCIRIMKGDNRVDDAELRYLLVGPTSDMLEKGPMIPAEWVGPQRWNEILTLARLPAFRGFETSIVSNLEDFKHIYDSVEAEKESLPDPWEKKLSPLQRLCFVRSFRIDCLKAAIIDFITQEIGGKFVDPPTFDIAKSYADSVNTTPLIFILSPGTDPVSDVIRFSEQVGMAKKFEPISLGQGQGPRAQSMIDRARQTGGWVLLSNCHLMQSWMPTLEAIVEQLDPETMSNNFRLWLTSMPAKSFPVQVLQNGVKMTNEPPSGLRANLLRSYTTVSDRLFEESNKPSVFKTLLFGFCFFHAVAQDRRKFGPIGWNIPYGFTPEDLAVCRQQLMLFVNKYKDVPYKVLNFLGAQINYGGRVTDDKDKLLISTILATFICPEAVNQKDQYKYSSSGIYFAPNAENVEEFVDYIRSLPLYPMPEAFGLHDNCNITCAQEEAFKLLLGMQSMVSAGGGGGDGKSADDVMDATAASIQDKLPKPFPLDVCEQKFPTRYEESMNTVVKQECLRYNKLLNTMESSLKAFRKAIKGLIVMTAELEELGKSIFVNEVPEMWSKKGPLSLKPLSSWFPDIIARVAFFQNWNDLGKTPPVHWISGIFFPQAFFTGAMQNYARKHRREIDLLSFSQKVMDNVTNPRKELTIAPEDGVYIYGLFMEGARWDSVTHMVQESQPKVLFTDLPPLWFLPVEDRKPNPKDYRCPTYKVLSRKGTLLTTGHSTNFVLYLELPTDQAVSKWIKAGVASFLALKH